MRKLELDFHRARRHPLRWALLLAGLASVGGVLVGHRQVTVQTRAETATRALIEAGKPANTRSISPADDAALTLARQTVTKTRQPWNELFLALEAADSKDVALLAFTPDTNRGEIRLQAEARNLAAMLAYHRRLESSGLRQVALVEHERSTETPEAPVRFKIVGVWGGQHGRP